MLTFVTFTVNEKFGIEKMTQPYDAFRKNYQNHNHLAIISFTTDDTSLFGGEDATWKQNLPSKGNTIQAYLPENFQLAFSSSFDQPFAQGFIQNDAIRSAANFAGYSLTSQAMTVHIWQGSSPLEFSLTFIFVADSDPVEDVVKKVALLTKLERPGRTKQGGLLMPPGPRVNLKDASGIVKAGGEAIASGTVLAANAAGSFFGIGDGVDPTDFAQKTANVGTALKAPVENPTNNISLWVGNMFYFRSVFVESVSQTYDTVMDQFGKPIKTQVDVTFKTFTTPTKADIDDIFVLNDHVL